MQFDGPSAEPMWEDLMDFPSVSIMVDQLISLGGPECQYIIEVNRCWIWHEVWGIGSPEPHLDPMYVEYLGELRQVIDRRQGIE
jgi:hypothetical protein